MTEDVQRDARQAQRANLGFAIKIDDGNNARAAEVAVAAAIEACLPLAGDDAGFMRGFSDCTLRNWQGIDSGRAARQRRAAQRPCRRHRPVELRTCP